MRNLTSKNGQGIYSNSFLHLWICIFGEINQVRGLRACFGVLSWNYCDFYSNFFYNSYQENVLKFHQKITIYEKKSGF